MYFKDVTPPIRCAPRASRRSPLGLALCGIFALFGAPSVLAAEAPGKPAAAATPDKKQIAQSALDAFQRRHKEVERLVAAKAKPAALQKEVDALLDYQALAQAALGGRSRYAQVCKSKCKTFDEALTRLIRENYLRFLRQSKGGEVEYLGTQVGRKGSAVKIKTQVKRPGKKGAAARSSKVSVSYVLQRRDAQDWQVVDIVTEGVSLRKTYRYEFQKIIETPGKGGGIDGVIAKIEAKLKSKP